MLLFDFTPDRDVSEGHTSLPYIRIELLFSKLLNRLDHVMLFLEYDSKILVKLARKFQ